MATDPGLLPGFRARIESALGERLQSHLSLEPRLLEAMRYAALGPGKRIRPLLTLATAQSLGSDIEQALAPACAAEFIHAYSLIHDDLPAMDDDDLRRGRPTVHKAFDDATAILAGDALQALAFETICDTDVSEAVRLDMITRLSRAVGAAGMVGGQALDMAATGNTITLDSLEALHDAKTGALLRVAVELGALCGNASASQLRHLSDFGTHLGRAFQVVDDLLDVTESTDTQGKRAGADAQAGKNTFPALMGIDESRSYAHRLHQHAIEALRGAGIEHGPLLEIAELVVVRRS